MKAVVFGKAGGKSSGAIERRNIDDLKSVLSDLPEDTLIYLDVHGLSDGERSRLLASTLRKAGRRVGIVDLNGDVKDVAALFHAGAVDYIGKPIGLGGLSPRRVTSVRGYVSLVGAARNGVTRGSARRESAVAGHARAERSADGASDGWEGVSDGREHKFSFLYIEVDDAEELKQRYEQDNLSAAMDTFRGFIEKIVSPHGGRLWMWSRFGGLVLFPLREPDFPAPFCGLRILLTRVFFDAEESPLPGRLSFRMALSIGSTVYDASDTGRIVSDGVNSIFHLGRRFARPGQFIMTADAAALTPEPLRPRLTPVGTFEGRRILRMLQPAPSAGDRG